MFRTDTHYGRNRGRLKTCLQMAACLLMTSTLCGCNAIILLGYLIGGPPSIEPEFDAKTNKSLSAKDVRVAVVCYAPLPLKYDFDKLDYDLAKHVTFKLHTHGIKVINPDLVHAWLDENKDWDRPEEIGEALQVDYVVYIDMQKFSLYEENSRNLYRGRAEALLSVYEIYKEGGGEKIYSKEINSKYPLKIPRSTYEVSYPTFKAQYFNRLSEEIGRQFYEHYTGDDFPDAI
jgi:hypothetical protein